LKPDLNLAIDFLFRSLIIVLNHCFLNHLRKIRLCKSCGRKFTPKNQKPDQVEDIQTEATSVTESKDPVAPDINERVIAEKQIPEQ